MTAKKVTKINKKIKQQQGDCVNNTKKRFNKAGTKKIIIKTPTRTDTQHAHALAGVHACAHQLVKQRHTYAVRMVGALAVRACNRMQRQTKSHK